MAEAPAPAAAAAPAEDPKVVTTPRGGGAAFEIPIDRHPDAESAVRQRLEGAPPSPRKTKEQIDQELHEAEARRLAAVEEVKAKAANEVERAEKKKEEHEAREKAAEGVPDPVITRQTERAVAFELDAGKRPGSASPTKHRLEGQPPSPRKSKEQIDQELAEAERRRQAELAAVKAVAADEVGRAQAVAAEAPKSPRKAPAEVPAAMAAPPQTEETPIVPKEPKPLDQMIAEDEAKRKKAPAPAAAEKKAKPAAAAKPKPPPTKTAVKPAAKSPTKATPTKATPTKAKPAAATPTKKASPAKPAAAPAAAAKKPSPKAPAKK